MISASEDMDVDRPASLSPYITRWMISVSEVYVNIFSLNLLSIIGTIKQQSCLNVNESMTTAMFLFLKSRRKTSRENTALKSGGIWRAATH